MSPVRFLSACFIVSILTLVLYADDPVKVEVETLDGKTIKGELDSIDAGNVAVKTASGVEKVPIKQVVGITTNRVNKAFPKQYDLVELTDGSKLMCSSIDVKKGNLVVKLTSGAQVTAPLSLVHYALRDAHDQTIMGQWTGIALKGRNFDGVIVAKRPAPNTVQLNDIPGTIGGEKDGKLEFTDKQNVKTDVAMDVFQALVFANGPPKTPLPQIFRVNDVDGNSFPVGKMAAKGDSLTFTTVAGVTIETPLTAVVKFDARLGNVAYLCPSELELAKEPDVSSNLLPDQKYRALFEPVVDKVKSPNSSDLLPIRMKGITYKHGLSLHARTELIYKVDGQYDWFKGMLGFSDDIGGLSVPINVEIYGDGKEIKKFTLNRETYKDPEKIEINIKGVDRLIIKVLPGGLLDSGWVEFAEARVSK